MILFLDSNVTIGYVFEGDRWHKHSINVLNCPNDKYYSTNVLNETKKKITKIKHEISDKILELRAFLLRNYVSKNFLTINDLEHVINIRRLQRIELYIVKLFNELYNFEAPKEEFLQVLINLANDFFSFYPLNFNQLQQQLFLHDRKRDYIGLLVKLKRIHKEDRIIFIDAHDLCNCTNFSLTFITADYETKKAKFILDNTNINDIKNLRDF